MEKGQINESVWIANSLSPEPSESEKEIRNRFAAEYVLDYDSIAAAARCGFMRNLAEDYAIKFLGEPYVQRRIKELEAGDGITSDVEREKKRVMATLWREANYRGAGASHAARVGAAARIASLLGMDAPIKTVNEHKVTTPVQFYLPHNGRDPLPVPVEVGNAS